MLFLGYFFCLIVAFAVVAMWLVGSLSNSMLEKQHHPRRAINQTVTAEQIAPLHLEATKEASRDDVSPVKHHKHKALARQHYGNAWGYADTFRNDPKGFFIH
jgi:hypothetical protein